MNKLGFSTMCSDVQLYARLLMTNDVVFIPLANERHIKIFLRSDGEYDYTVWKDCVGYFWEHGSGDKCYEHGYSCTDSVIDKIMPDGTEICVTLSSYVEEDSAVVCGSARDAVEFLLPEELI